MNFNSLTKAQLRSLLVENDIAFASNLTKAQLVAVCEANSAAIAAEENSRLDTIDLTQAEDQDQDSSFDVEQVLEHFAEKDDALSLASLVSADLSQAQSSSESESESEKESDEAQQEAAEAAEEAQVAVEEESPLVEDPSAETNPEANQAFQEEADDSSPSLAQLSQNIELPKEEIFELLSTQNINKPQVEQEIIDAVMEEEIEEIVSVVEEMVKDVEEMVEEIAEQEAEIEEELELPELGEKLEEVVEIDIFSVEKPEPTSRPIAVPKLSKFRKFCRYLTITLFLSSLGMVGNKLAEVKNEQGFCTESSSIASIPLYSSHLPNDFHGFDLTKPNQLLQNIESKLWSNVEPYVQCEPCPANSQCKSSDTLKCNPGFVKTHSPWHYLSLGQLPQSLTTSCEKDTLSELKLEFVRQYNHKLITKQHGLRLGDLHKLLKVSNNLPNDQFEQFWQKYLVEELKITSPNEDTIIKLPYDKIEVGPVKHIELDQYAKHQLPSPDSRQRKKRKLFSGK